jgi:hypothetical protein
VPIGLENALNDDTDKEEATTRIDNNFLLNIFLSLKSGLTELENFWAEL